MGEQQQQQQTRVANEVSLPQFAVAAKTETTATAFVQAEQNQVNQNWVSHNAAESLLELNPTTSWSDPKESVWPGSATNDLQGKTIFF